MEDGLGRVISKVHVGELNGPGELGVGSCAVRLVQLPGKEPCVGLGFLKPAVFLLGGDQGDGAAVGFRGFCEQGEDPLRPGQSHGHHADLLGDLLDGHGEGFGQGEEGHDDAGGDAAHPGQGHAAAHQGQENVLQVADLVENGHEHVAVPVGHPGLVEEVVVFGGEPLGGLLFVTEDFDHLLPAQHLLNIAVDLPQRGLLAHKIPGAGPTDLFG